MPLSFTLAGLMDESGEMNRVDVERAIASRSEPLLAEVQPGEAVAVPLDNNIASVIDLLTVWQMEMVPIIVQPNLEEDRLVEILKYLRARFVIGSSGLTKLFDGLVKSHPKGAFLQSSGSTGQRKLCHRTAASLMAEGNRYHHIWGNMEGKVVSLLAPVHHAFAFGAMMGCLISGARARLVKPTHLGACRRATLEANVTVLTPAIARLLVRRAGLEDMKRTQSTEALVIAGAGPVDPALDSEFAGQFGTRLARNYGSVETGALLYGEPGGPAFALGGAMHGVRCQLLDNAAANGPRRLGVIVEGNDQPGWHDTGDLAQCDGDGIYTLLGRADDAIRRGERFVPYVEIEQSVVALPEVRATRARRDTSLSGGGSFHLDVWPQQQEGIDAKSIQAFLAASFPASDLPDRIEMRSVPPYTATGKLALRSRYSLASPELLSEVARSYKRAKLLFALHELGVLKSLGEADLDSAARSCNLSVRHLEFALRLAENYGLVNQGSPCDHETADSGTIISLEGYLEREVNSVASLKSVIAGNGSIDLDEAEFLPLYADVMASRGTLARARLVLRALADINPPKNVVEVGFSEPVYLKVLPPGWGTSKRCFIPLCETATSLAETDEVIEFLSAAHLETSPIDMVIFSRSLHWPKSGRLLNDVIKNMERFGGRILIDDIFLGRSDASADMAMDWLTHASLTFADIDGLEDYLASMGANVNAISVAGMQQPAQPDWHVLLALVGDTI